MTAVANGTSKEVAKEANKSVFDDNALTGIGSMAEAIAMLNKANVPNDSIKEYGTGFEVLETKDKTRLVGVPFVILEWQFRDGDNGRFVSALVVTNKDEKLILNDGSTGIRDQLASITAKRIESGRGFPQQGLAVEKGLRVSEYDYLDEKTGEMRPAKTFYLA